MSHAGQRGQAEIAEYQPDQQASGDHHRHDGVEAVGKGQHRQGGEENRQSGRGADGVDQAKPLLGLQHPAHAGGANHQRDGKGQQIKAVNLYIYLKDIQM